MAITVVNLQKILAINPSQIKKLTKQILEIRNSTAGDISLVFVDKRKIKQLNKKFLGKANLTDVLSFENSPNNVSKRIICGDIVISTDAAIQNARIFKTSAYFEIRLYLAHGLLHLLGYDDNNQKNIKIMRQKEKQILDFLD